MVQSFGWVIDGSIEVSSGRSREDIWEGVRMVSLRVVIKAGISFITSLLALAFPEPNSYLTSGGAIRLIFSFSLVGFEDLFIRLAAGSHVLCCFHSELLLQSGGQVFKQDGNGGAWWGH
jgi:hypothetical protein